MTPLRSTRWTLLLPAAVGLLLAVLVAPSVGYHLDDWIHALLLDQGRLDIYRFARGDPAANQAAMDAGALPWFATPDLEITFLRPLSAALHGLDHALFGRSPVLAALHSAAWYAALCGVVTALFQRSLPERLVLPGALLFAIAGTHAQPVAWLAARNALICATLGGLGLLAHVVWRQDGSTGPPAHLPGALAPLGLALGLLAGEAGLGLVAYVVAYEIVGRGDSPWRRLLALLPAALVTGAWLLAYLLLDAGVHGSGAYLDPLREPVAFLSSAPGRLTYALGVLLAGLSADAWYLYPRLHRALSVGGLLVAAPLLAWLASTLVHAHASTRRAVGWLALGAGLALIPQLAGLLGARSFMVPSLGGCAVVALLVLDGLSSQGRGLALRRAGAVVLLLGHGAFALTQWVLMPWALLHARTTTDCALDALTALDLPDDAAVVLLTAPGPELATYATTRGRVTGEPVSDLLPLTLGPRTVRIERRERHVWDVTLLDGTWLDSGFARLYRRPGTLPAGRGVQLDRLNAHVLDDRDGDPTRVRFVAEPPVVLVAWHEGALRRVDLVPGEVLVVRP